MRFKRYKKRYGGTRAIKMKIQSFMDINTSASSMQIITISAGGPEILRRLSPQFAAYKYYRLGNISVKLVPASTLPVDPTGLSYEAGENTVDPRDQLTPGLMRITNGEDIFENISGLTDAEQHGIYNNMLLDPRWFKWMLQSGVKRHATPRFWQIGQLHQDKWPGAEINVPYYNATSAKIEGTDHINFSTGGGIKQGHADGSTPYGLFQTGHSGRIGWLPTDGLGHSRQDSPGPGGIGPQPFIAAPVEVECFKLVLPKMYKTEYYYRLFITETVYFKSPIVNFGIAASDNLCYRPLDIFHTVGAPAPVLPSYAQNPALFPTDEATGGNYGDD